MDQDYHRLHVKILGDRSYHRLHVKILGDALSDFMCHATC